MPRQPGKKTARRSQSSVKLASIPNIRVGFLATRLAGTDGVSLEVRKWVDILKAMGHQCYYYAGLCDYPEEESFITPEAFFLHDDTEQRHKEFFSNRFRVEEDTRWIEDRKQLLKKSIREFIDKFDIQLLIAQNSLTIPMNIPLGLAITEVISETGLPTIAHHHDFYWERHRYLIRNVNDYLRAAFPPDIDNIQHVVINSLTQRQLASYCGLSSTIIPNIMPFEQAAPPPDQYADDLRERLELEDDELFVLQPTRVIPRKGIEHAVELIRNLGRKAALVISHSAGDEGDQYAVRVRNYASALGVRTIFASDIIEATRRTSETGEKIYGLDDAYQTADLITFPSIYEGFGNAFLEAVYFRKPIVVNRYPAYAKDIGPKGFQVIEFDNFITEETLKRVRAMLDSPKTQKKMANHNYELGLRYFSYSLARYKLRALFANSFGLEMQIA